jgi:hypothetical protein
MEGCFSHLKNLRREKKKNQKQIEEQEITTLLHSTVYFNYTERQLNA